MRYDYNFYFIHIILNPLWGLVIIPDTYVYRPKNHVICKYLFDLSAFSLHMYKHSFKLCRNALI